MLPVGTDWFVTRNVSTSPSVCAPAGADTAAISATSAARRLMVVTVHLQHRRLHRTVRLHVPFARYRAAVADVIAFRFFGVVGRSVGHDRRSADAERQVRTATAEVRNRALERD